jgi:hypothetical protein
MNPITTTSAGYQEMPIHDLMDGIRAENTKARSMAQKSLDHVRTCGEMLIAMKARVAHGTWLFELRNIGIERKTASNYMRIAENWGTVSHLNRGVKDALKLLARADDPPSPAPRPTPAPVTIEAEIVEPSPAPPVTPAPQVEVPHAVVVDGTKDQPAKKSGWDMARDFIATLKPLDVWEQRQALCDLRAACDRRLQELRGPTEPPAAP